MKKIKSVQIAFFSGTGCTAYVADRLAEDFRLLGVRTDLLDISRACREKIKKGAKEASQEETQEDMKADLLLILYPVYALSIPLPMLQWLKKLSFQNGKRAAVISVSGGGNISPNTACRIEPIKILKKKGYTVRYESMLTMPSNIFIKYSDTIAAGLIKVLPQKTRYIAEQILENKRERMKPQLLDRVLVKVAFLERFFGAYFATMLYVADECTGCSLCVKNCPRNNITLEGEKPKFHEKCVICLRCIYECPCKAIKPSKIAKIIVIKEGFELKKWIEMADKWEEAGTILQVPKGYAYKGIREYLKQTDLEN